MYNFLNFRHRTNLIYFSKKFCHNNNNVKLVETIKNLLEQPPSEDQLYKVYGWIRGRIQKKKTKWFLQLDDGSTLKRLQIVLPISLVNEIHNGISVECIGRLSKSLGNQQALDFHCEKFTIIGQCPPEDYKIGHLKTGLELDLLRKQIHLRPRVKYFQSILRIRNQILSSIHKFMNIKQFIQVQTPLITANDCEGGGECFTLNPVNWNPNTNPDMKSYFNRQVYLTVSGQLHLEALASSLSRVYTIQQVFRAEKSMSPKHLSEFLMLEMEQAFIFELDLLMNFVENLIKFIIDDIENTCNDDLNYLLEQNNYHKYFNKIKSSKFKCIEYTEALKILEDNKYPNIDSYKSHTNLNINLNASMERFLIETFDNCPVFIKNFPIDMKPFYMKQNIQNPNIAECFDLLTPICGEVCGGSLRENRLEILENQMKNKLKAGNGNDIQEQQQQQQQLQWYLDLRRFGSCPTGGFGLGFDRLLQTICGINNIKDVVPFPRWPYHCYL